MGTFTITLPDSDDKVVEPLSADEIRWALEPLVPLEATDVLTLTDNEHILYTRELQQEMAAMRTLAHVAVGQVYILTQQLTAARGTIRDLRRRGLR
jgi:hypothetical protein